MSDALDDFNKDELESPLEDAETSGELNASAPILPEPELPQSEISQEEVPAEFPAEGASDRAWYVVHCYSGYENKVRYNLEQRIETMGMKDRIFDVVIPTQEEIEVRDGKRKTVERHVFPGYVLVNMILTEESWYVVRNTRGVTGFVGPESKPVALTDAEVEIMLNSRPQADACKLVVGEEIRILSGPLENFTGIIESIDAPRGKMQVKVKMFLGREMQVEIELDQAEKI